MKFIDELDLKGKKVFIRADLDVPLDDAGNITDDHRVRCAAPTVKFVIDNGGSAIVAGHMGRPKGKVVSTMSTKCVAPVFEELLKTKVMHINNCVGAEVTSAAKNLKAGEVLVLENLRFHNEEEQNSAEFSKQLASLADVYVNNAFATAHRAHASTYGMATYFKEKCAGLVIKSEIDFFNKALKNPQRPLVAIFGGAKVSSKLKAIENVKKAADAIIIGGAMANTFFKAQGLECGKSLVENDLLETAKKILAEESNCKIILPVDVVVAEKLESGSPKSTVKINAIPKDKMALDVGPESVKHFAKIIEDAKTIIWNGPMGAFETPDFSEGTFGLVDILVNSKAIRVAGGGDTDLALHQKHAVDKMDYVSTGGGAFLTLLEGEKLVALEALS